MEMLNAGFTTPKQVEQLLKLPLLSSVGYMSGKDLIVDGRSLSPPVFVLAKPLSRYSEAIRAVRSGIQMTDVDNPPKVIQITSAIPNEGKSTIAQSLAVSAAVGGTEGHLDRCRPPAPLDLELSRPWQRQGTCGSADWSC